MPERAEMSEEGLSHENENLRKEKIESLIGDQLPVPDYLAIVAERDGVPVDQLTQESRELAEYNQRLYQSVKESIIEKFKDTQVPDSELESYVTEVFQFAEKSRPNIRNWDNLRWNVNNVIEASDSLERLRVWDGFFEEWEKEIVDVVDDPKIKDQRVRDFEQAMTDISGHNKRPTQIRPLPEVQEQARFSVDLYKYKYSIESQFPRTENYGEYHADELIADAKRVALMNHDTEQGKRILQLFDDNKTVDRFTLSRLMDTASRYGGHFGFSETAKVGFEKNILPALQKKDPQVDVLQQAGNVWAMKRGEFGLGDFVCHSYCSEVKPENINKLMMALHEVPTSNYQKLEQNRKDGLTMNRDFGALRDFIHDQRPLVREVITAMVKYYETKDSAELKSLLPKTEGYLDTPERIEAILDLSKYDTDIEDKDKQTMKVIDVLRRLAENTKIVEEEPPQTSNEGLNNALENLSEASGKEGLLAALQTINGLVETAIREKRIGIEPNMILALAFVERKVFAVLQKLTYEDQLGLYKEPWFQELLKFQELTNSTEYNPEDFSVFMQEFRNSKSPKEAYKLVGGRIISHISDLSKVYSNAGKSEMSGALWSGNVNHELMALIDLKPATTRYGERHREEQVIPPYLRHTGD